MQIATGKMTISSMSLILLLLVLGQRQVQVDAQLLGGIKGFKVLPANLAGSIKEGVSSTLGNATTGLKNVSHKAQDKVEDKIGDTAKAIGKIAGSAVDTAQNAVVKIGNATIGEVNDCLGLGTTLSTQFESLLKKDDNGTRAQEAHFYLHSRRQPRKVEVMIGNQFGLEWTDFEVRRNTVVIVHGFLSNGNETWIKDMTDAFLKMADVNVIAVDWSDGGDTYNYLKAVVNTQTTGNQIATLFGQIANYTLERNGPSKDQWGSIHCVGHSLGAHICGYAAHEIKRRGADWKIRRITGLDPAQPCFKTADLALKLDKNDAPFVDIIHTNGRFLSEIGLGLPQAIGHVDFYPNGGKQQPGCEVTSFTIPVLSIPREVLNKAICSHGRSYLYFTESIINSVTNNCTFLAHPWDRTYRNIDRILSINCQSNMCIEMGVNSDKYKFRGTFFALTSSAQPYCHTGYWDREEVKEILKEDFKDTLED